MPNEEVPVVRVRFTPEFKRNLRALSKKYRHIRSDVQPVIDQIQAGEFIGDQIPRVKYTVFKVRVKNSDIKKGKQAGYRFIFLGDGRLRRHANHPKREAGRVSVYLLFENRNGSDIGHYLLEVRAI